MVYDIPHIQDKRKDVEVQDCKMIDDSKEVEIKTKKKRSENREVVIVFKGARDLKKWKYMSVSKSLN